MNGNQMEKNGIKYAELKCRNPNGPSPSAIKMEVAPKEKAMVFVESHS